MAVGRRCGPGCATWPDAPRYHTCPVCSEETARYNNVEPMSQEDADRAEFEVFYARWDANHDSARLASDAADARGRFGRVVDVRPALLARRSGPAS